jgi:hypothetical protein
MSYWHRYAAHTMPLDLAIALSPFLVMGVLWLMGE